MILVDGLSKSFSSARTQGGVPALMGVSFRVEPGEFFTLLGPSGCGKTTTLRCAAGLERPDSGTIKIGDEVVSASGVFVPPNKRHIGMVFQTYAVWPHLTVRQNIEYPLRFGHTRPSRRDVERRVSDVLEVVGLTSVADRDAPLLSGGQQQRVALARALVAQPRVLLLDEPLSNLDARLRITMRDELRRLTRDTGVTSLYVTHDQSEALAMSDRIAVMNGGRIEQIGTPIEIYRRPATRFVAAFVGNSNFLAGRVIGQDDEGFSVVETPHGTLRATEACPSPDGAQVSVMVRPEAIHLGARREVDDSSRWNEIIGRVEGNTFLGDHTLSQVRVGDVVMTCRLQTYEQVHLGQEVQLRFAARWCWVLPAETISP